MSKYRRIKPFEISPRGPIVGGLALGGTIAAPFAAKLVGILPAKQLGIVVAVAIILLNAVAIIRA